MSAPRTPPPPGPAAARRNAQPVVAPRTSHLSRRRFLRSAGTGLAAAFAGSSALALMACEKKAPAVKAERGIHILQWSHWLKEVDAEVMRQAAEFQSQTGVKVTIETLNLNDIVTRATVAVETRTGPDIIQMLANQPHLFSTGLTDVSEIAGEIGAAHGGWGAASAAVCQVDGRFLAIPYSVAGMAMCWRMDTLAQVGVERLPGTWPELLDVGRKLKHAGMPIGQSLGHTIGDAPAFCYSLLWSFGGRELADDGQTVAIASPETLAALGYMAEFWPAACDSAGMSWDDSANNRAFLSGTLGGTFNGASIYFVARYNAENHPGLADQIGHSLMPVGPAGRYHLPQTSQHGIMNYSPNRDAALDYMRFLMAKENYEKWFLAARGYNLGAGEAWVKHPMWDADPRLAAFPLAVPHHRLPGWPGAPNRRASEAQAKYIVTDMFAKVVQGTETPEGAAAWAEKELRNVYQRG